MVILELGKWIGRLYLMLGMMELRLGELQANLAIMKCRNPANPFTIARFHYRGGSREVTKG